MVKDVCAELIATITLAMRPLYLPLLFGYGGQAKAPLWGLQGPFIRLHSSLPLRMRKNKDASPLQSLHPFILVISTCKAGITGLNNINLILAPPFWGKYRLKQYPIGGKQPLSFCFAYLILGEPVSIVFVLPYPILGEIYYI